MMVSLLLVPLQAQAQTAADAFRFSQRSPATGARMLGMGGAGVAGLADYGAFVANPAGLAYLERSLAAGALHTFAVSDEAVYRAAGASNTLEDDARSTALGNLAYLYKVPTERGSLVLGGALNQVHLFDRTLAFQGQNPDNSITEFFLPIGGEFDARQLGPQEDPELFHGQFVVEDASTGEAYLVDFDPDGDGFVNRPLSYVAFETFGIDFDARRFHEGAASPFVPAVQAGTIRQTGRVVEGGDMKELSVGGAVEALETVMVGGSLNLAFGTYEFRDVFEEVDFRNDNDGAQGTIDFESLQLTRSFESDLVGVSARLGVASNVTSGLRVGLTMETPTYYSIDETSNIVLETLFDNGDLFVYGDDRSEQVGRTEFEYELLTPWRFSVGAAYEVAQLKVLADAEVVDWSQMELQSATDEFFFDEVNQEIEARYEMVVNTRVGLEYQLGNLFLRGGFAYQPDPRDAPVFASESDGPDRSQTFYSAGVGFRFNEQVQLNLGWMQERFDDQYRPYTEVTGAPVVNESVQRNRFLMGVRFAF